MRDPIKAAQNDYRLMMGFHSNGSLCRVRSDDQRKPNSKHAYLHIQLIAKNGESVMMLNQRSSWLSQA
jgi:hypothetical protein